MYTVIDALESRHIPQLMRLYAQCPWARDRTQAEAEALVRGSTYVFGLVDGDDNLLGFARVLSDGVCKAFIFDVVVDERLRGIGLGVMLLDAVVSHPQLSKVKHIELYCKESMIPWYERFGFSESLGDLHTMRRINS